MSADASLLFLPTSDSNYQCNEQLEYRGYICVTGKGAVHSGELVSASYSKQCRR